MLRLTGGFGAQSARPAFVVLALSLAALAACSDDDSSTELNPDGPPMIRQVFVQEKVRISETSVRLRTGLAFGDHPDISADVDDRQVDNAVARGLQRIRVVFDELVVGNAIEEIACADGTFGQVPIGATPDDIADCTGELENCTKVCIGASGPIGVLDENFDGASDDTRMITYNDGNLAVRLLCGGESMPLDAQQSFYNPSGNQLIPAGDIGTDGLGPAMVLVPTQGLRTGSSCTIEFASEVTDKDGNSVCAPDNGDVTRACPGDGDTSLIAFNVEPLVLDGSDPEDGADDVSPSANPVAMLLKFNAAISADSLAAVTLSDAVPTPVVITTAVSVDDPSIVNITVPGGLAATTTYTITASTDLTDIFGGPLPEAVSITFTTSAAP